VISHAVMDSPVGPLTLAASDGVLSGLYMEKSRYPPGPELLGPRDDSVLRDVAEQLAEYFAGTRTEFEIPLALNGTPFQRRVWTALREIPYGETMSYAEVAMRLGVPRGARAVGLANGRNPISIIIPCHRLVGSTGKLTGYGGGLDRKAFLLHHELTTRSHPD
jgi:methylated-DNA-[protein]-cysteine S-methyltransferase